MSDVVAGFDSLDFGLDSLDFVESESDDPPSVVVLVEPARP